jgi:two-component system, OmpR family, sensor histidine kinase KdpD
VLLALTSSDEMEVVEGVELTSKEWSVCRWALDHGQAAGRFTDTLPESLVLALPLAVNGKNRAVLGLRPADSRLASPVTRDLLETFATHFCVMLEKEEHMRSQREAVLAEKSRQFQRALLDHVSHEIKTPVAVIQAVSDHLIKGPPDTALLAEIRDAASRLNRVFTQLVTLSRAEAGLIQPVLEMCDAHDLIHEVLERFPKASIVIRDATFTFRTDPSILDAILFNLFQNAVQHGSGSVEVGLERSGGLVHFEISNGGIPIPESERNRIFERFQRGGRTGAGGMGLGLAIIREFCHILSGEVVLKRSDGAGTVFQITLPDS